MLLAPPGAGKTTRVPPALLDAGIAGDGAVVVLEPRRIAARAAAARISAERGGEVGGEVGYHVRFDRRLGPATRIRVETEGVFLREIQGDPLLDGVGAVVLDEFHERGLAQDLVLGMLRRVRDEARPDLAVVAMSATAAAAPVAAFLGVPVVEAAGRAHPVEIRYLPGPDTRAPAARATAGVAGLLAEGAAGVLAFLPGVAEIRATAKALEAAARRHGARIFPLYGDLPAAEQDAALRGPGPKVVLATNVAETSVTVEGVSAVVDTGLARVLAHDPARGLDRLAVRWISRASADQRAGRAGRTGPGICLRLWTEREHRGLPERDEPEVVRADLAGAVLELLVWGERDATAFPWLTPPPPGAVTRALALLSELGAVRDGRPTPVGREMASLPVHPRLSRLLVEGARLGAPRRAALAAALLSERETFRREEAPRPAEHRSESDVLDRVEALEDFERRRTTRSAAGEVLPGAARFALRARDQFARLLRAGREDRAADPDEALLRAVFAAFPDRLCRRREAGGPRAVLARGGASLLPGSAVLDAPLFVGVDMEAGGARGGEARVRLASGVRREWLPAAECRTDTALAFDEATERVTAVRRVLWRGLAVEEGPTAVPEGADVGAALAAAAAERLSRALDLSEAGTRSFLARAACLAEWRPDLGLPEFGEGTLRALLPALCAGRRSFAETRRVPLAPLLEGVLTPEKRRALSRLAPERVEVPSGSRVRLIYEPGRPPVLAVRIQEVFGLTETPSVAGGKVKVLLHLLAPNHRPQQVTDDLPSFWTNVYPKVRSELRRRYPKHSWPEDPLRAPPVRRPL